MKENFIKTLTIESRPYIFRYELQPGSNTYSVSVINHKEITPFEMVETPGNGWKIETGTESFLHNVEDLLSEIIIAQNSIKEVAS